MQNNGGVLDIENHFTSLNNKFEIMVEFPDSAICSNLPIIPFPVRLLKWHLMVKISQKKLKSELNRNDVSTLQSNQYKEEAI